MTAQRRLLRLKRPSRSSSATGHCTTTRLPRRRWASGPESKPSGLAATLLSGLLKRAPTILGKLVREPNMQLSTMQDIAGCRAVLDSVTQLRAVQERFKTETIVRLDDYIERPKASGYRGVHLVVRYTDRHGGSRSEFSFGRRSSMTGRSPLSRWGARLTAS